MEEISKDGQEKAKEENQPQNPPSEEQKPAAAPAKETAPAGGADKKEQPPKRQDIVLLSVLGGIIVLVTVFFLISAVKAGRAKKEAFELRSSLKQLKQDFAEKEEDFKTRLSEALASGDELEKKISELTETNNRFRIKIQEAGKYVQALKDDLRGQRKDILAELNEFLTANKKTEQALTDKINDLSRLNEDLQKTVSDLSYIAKVKPEEIREMADTIALDKIVVAPGRPQEEKKAPSYSGKVLNVNNRYDFAVVDLGEEHGLKQGARLSVMRKKKKIAELSVKETYTYMSLANIIKGRVKADVQKGDDVIFIP